MFLSALKLRYPLQERVAAVSRKNLGELGARNVIRQECWRYGCPEVGPWCSLSSLERSTERPMPSELPGEDARGALAVASNRPRPGAVLNPPHPAAPAQGRRSRGSQSSPASGEAFPRPSSPGGQHA